MPTVRLVRRHTLRHPVPPCGARRGTALVEFAVVLPLFMLLVIGAIDVGRAINVRHTLIEAARAGGRLYAVKRVDESPTMADVEAAIDRAMQNARLSNYTVAFTPDAAAPAVDLTPITVSISIPYNDVCWLPSWFLAGEELAASCTMPADAKNSF